MWLPNGWWIITEVTNKGVRFTAGANGLPKIESSAKFRSDREATSMARKALRSMSYENQDSGWSKFRCHARLPGQTKAFSEWLRGLETASKARVYKAAVDQLVDTMAAGAWQDGPAPKDGSWILGLFHGLPYVVGYDSWEVGGEMLSDGTGSPPDGHESGWCLAGDNLQVMDQDEPEKWARIIHPNRHMPASWDGPGDRS